MTMDIDLKHVQLLKWPEDSSTIAQLSLEEKIMWYSGQEPRHMVYLGNSPAFKRWWHWHYMMPLKLKRFAYKLKNLVWNPYV
jgi:hypothetical protein